MRKLFRFFLLSLVLLLVCLSSALLAMRFAIHGREVRVPKLEGLPSTEAERAAGAQGLVLSIESRFYSAEVPEGRIASQIPPAGAKVRRGGKVRAAESLGAQRAAVPNLVGQSEHAAGINVGRRGLEISTAAVIHYPGAAPNTVVAQSPPADTRRLSSPRIGLIMSAVENTQWYIMPRFIGRPLAEAKWELQQAGFSLGTVEELPVSTILPEVPISAGTIVRQYPAAGQKVAAGASINFEITK